MRLAAKLSLAVLALCAVGMAVAGTLIIRREYHFADREIAQHGRLLGRAIASSVEETWLRQGEGAVGELLAEIDRHDPGIRVRWVPLTAGGSGVITAEVRARLRAGKIVDHINRDDDDTLYTLVPIVRGNGRVERVVEIAESLQDRDRHIRLLVTSIVAAMVGGLLVSGVAVFLLGGWLVGRPVTALVAKARRVGQGDLSTPVEVAGRDELHDLALELNAMARGLAEARARAEEEARRRREAQEQLRHAERLATVGKLAAGVAHEMGTPLNVISECARRIGEGGADVERHVETIGRHASRITEIVKSLLRFARRSPAARNRLDMVQVIEHTLPLLRGASGRRPVEIVQRIEVEDAPVEGDEEQLEQVLTNLVVNAVQAMPDGGRITIGVSRRRCTPPGDPAPPREHLCLSVEDQGIGIPADVLPHVFDPFFTTKDVGQGTGLGLSICFGIVREHGGWIEVDSKPGEGSRFSVYLPVPAKETTGGEQESEVSHGSQAACCA